MFGEIATVETRSLNAQQNVGVRETDAKVQGRAIYTLSPQADFKGISVEACRQTVRGGVYTGTQANWVT